MGTVKKNSKPKDDILVIVDEDVDDDDDDDVDQDPPGASGANQNSDQPIDKKELKTRASLLHPIPPQSGAEAGKRHQWTYEESVNIWKGVQVRECFYVLLESSSHSGPLGVQSQLQRSLSVHNLVFFSYPEIRGRKLEQNHGVVQISLIEDERRCQRQMEDDGENESRR